MTKAGEETLEKIAQVKIYFLPINPYQFKEFSFCNSIITPLLVIVTERYLLNKYLRVSLLKKEYCWFPCGENNGVRRSVLSNSRLRIRINSMRIRILFLPLLLLLILIKVMRIWDYWSADPPGLYFEPPLIHGPLWLHFEPLMLMNFDFNAGPDPASKNNADPCGSGSATLHIIFWK